MLVFYSVLLRLPKPLQRAATVQQPGQNRAEQRRIIATKKAPQTSYLCVIVRHTRTQQEPADALAWRRSRVRVLSSPLRNSAYLCGMDGKAEDPWSSDQGV